MDGLPERRHLAHGVKATADGPTIVFVIATVHHRRALLANGRMHAMLVDVWRSAAAWTVGRYVVMPDHLHLFATPAGDLPLDNWVRFWKGRFTRVFGEAIWQTDHFDTRMRTATTYGEKQAYVLENPVRAGLVTRAADWPYAGELNALVWR